MANSTPPITPLSDHTVKVIVAAQSISHQVGRPVSIAPGTYGGYCERGASAVAGALTNDPNVTAALGANAFVSRDLYSKTGYWNPASPVVSTNSIPAETLSQINNPTVGTVLCFQSSTGGPGHTMIYAGDGSWMSDNASDNPSKFINSAKYNAISIVTPTDKGVSTINNSYPGIQNGSVPQYVTPPQESVGSAQGGQSYNPTQTATTPDQLITLNDQYFNGVGAGGMAPVEPLNNLQSKAKQPYSNRQFVSPIALKINVEGVYKDIDFLQKQLSTNNYNPYKRNIVLSLNSAQIARTGVTITGNRDRNAKSMTLKQGKVGEIANQFIGQHDLTQSVFNAGNNAITQALGSRVPSLQDFAGSNKYVSTGLAAVNQIPGAPAITGALSNITSNPLNAVTSLSKSLNIQSQLPSVSLGSLTKIFTLASTTAASGPPTSIAGIIALEQQAKELACNFVPPNITIPSLSDIFNIKITDLEQKVLDEIKKIEKQIADFFSYQHLIQILNDLIPDPNELLQAMYDKFFKCEAGPTAKKNDLSGKSDTAAAEVVAANAAPQPPPPTAPASAEAILPVQQPVQIITNQTADYQGTATQVSTVNAYQSPTNSVTMTLPSYAPNLIPPGTLPVPVPTSNSSPAIAGGTSTFSNIKVP